MYSRTEYEMSEEDLQGILQPRIPEMLIGGYSTSSMQQSSANTRWEALGKKMGFDYMTVRPVSGKGQRWFSAIPSETAEAKAERIEREGKEARRQEIETLENEIAERQKKLKQIQDIDAVYPNGQKKWAKDGTLLDENGNRSIFDDVDA